MRNWVRLLPLLLRGTFFPEKGTHGIFFPKINILMLLWVGLQLLKKLLLIMKIILMMKNHSLRNRLWSKKLHPSSRWSIKALIFLSRRDFFSRTILFLLRNISLSRKYFLRVSSLHLLLKTLILFFEAFFIPENYLFSWNFSTGIKRAICSFFKAKEKSSSSSNWWKHIFSYHKNHSSHLETLPSKKSPSFACYKERLDHITFSKLPSSWKLLSIISLATAKI